jgi:hypothetical protein
MINGAVSLLRSQPSDQDQQCGPKQCSRWSADGNEGKAAGGNKDIGKNKNRENEYVQSKDPIKKSGKSGPSIKSSKAYNEKRPSPADGETEP